MLRTMNYLLVVLSKKAPTATITPARSSLQSAPVLRSEPEAFAGDHGAYADYLANTVRHLDELGIRDGALHSLLRYVEWSRAPIPPIKSGARAQRCIKLAPAVPQSERNMR